MSDFLVVSAAALATVAVLMTVTALWAKQVGRLAVVDIVWGAGFVVVAVVSVLVGLARDTVDAHAWVVLVLVALWGGRLAWHIRSRAHGLLTPGEKPPEDPRYAELMDGKPFSYAVTRVFVTQGVAMWFVSLPVQVAVALDLGSGWSDSSGLGWTVLVVGVLVWAVGLYFEAVGDAQMEAYKKEKRAAKDAGREDFPTVMDRGLWRYTRHPNYFGDACVWWGIWLAGALSVGWGVGLATVLAPVAMTYFLAFATGARLLERTMMQRDGYPEYARRTSMFFPLPPKG